MGHRLHQPGPCYSSFQKHNSSSTAVAQDQWWLKINDGSRTMLAQEPARALLLEVKAQSHWFNQRWFTNLTAQETGWLKNKTGSIAMMAQEQWWLHFDRLQANKYTPQSWSINVQLQGQWVRPARCFRSWLFYTLLSATACTFWTFSTVTHDISVLGSPPTPFPPFPYSQPIEHKKKVKLRWWRLSIKKTITPAKHPNSNILTNESYYWIFTIESLLKKIY